MYPRTRFSSSFVPLGSCDLQYSKKDEEDEQPKDLTADAADLFSLGRKLVSLAVANSSGGGVSSFFSYTSPSSGVYEVSINVWEVDHDNTGMVATRTKPCQ